MNLFLDACHQSNRSSSDLSSDSPWELAGSCRFQRAGSNVALVWGFIEFGLVWIVNDDRYLTVEAATLAMLYVGSWEPRDLPQ